MQEVRGSNPLGSTGIPDPSSNHRFRIRRLLPRLTGSRNSDVTCTWRFSVQSPRVSGFMYQCVPPILLSGREHEAGVAAGQHNTLLILDQGCTIWSN